MKFFFPILIFVASSAFSQSIFENPDLIKNEGYFDTYYNEAEDKMYLEVVELDSAFLYISALSQGIGNNDLFLDRGQIKGSRVVHFKKAGNKLLLVMPNLMFRSITANDLERKSVEEAFSKSVLYGFPIIEKTAKGYLIDITDFLLQDTHGVIAVLKSQNQGDYSVDLSRSALNLERTKSFPKNVDFDALITLKTTNPKGSLVRSVTPDPEFLTVYQHHSFIELPDANYTPRKAHPNSGSFSMSYMDYASPIGSPMEVKYNMRHRLEKENPNAARSKAKEPIVYYLDNGTPEPVRTALLEGAAWWNQAFEAIGYIDAFQVKILPDTIDPLDVRYNVIQWVHRSTRGWSYGNAVNDPRTGEIIKGHVSLGSLRVRQDYKIAQALLNGSDDEAALEFALARIKQLSAHEVGHTLGFAHNFAASLSDRASVMDYPHPLVKLDEENIDISDAYAIGIGAWDKVSVAYLYSELEEEELEAMINAAFGSGLRYVTDADSRPIGSANAFGHLWDNGSDPVEELKRVMKVRDFAINQFNSEVLKEGQSYAELEDLYVLLYFFHRYQVEAAVKLIGGKEYGYPLKGEMDEVAKWVNESDQREALNAVLSTLDSEFLKIPVDKLALFPERGYGTSRDRESFSSKAGLSFDPITVAESAADFVLARLLHPNRVNRVFLQSKLNDGQLSIDEFLSELLTTAKLSTSDPYELEIQKIVNHSIFTHLFTLAQNEDLYPQVKAIVNVRIQEYGAALKKSKSAYDKEMKWVIAAYFEHPEKFKSSNAVKVPDGSPIGSFGCGF